MKKICTLLLLLIVAAQLPAATYVVTNGNDSGAGSLRQAITDANASAGSDLITFSIPATDPSYNAARHIWILTPTSTYPYFIDAGITIDGTTQAINQGDSNVFGPEIFVDGQNTLTNAFILATPANTIKGITVSRCSYAIVFYNSSCTGNLVTECYIGTDETGSLAMGNVFGIGASGGATGNTISKCLVSGNQQAGIAVQTSGPTTITGNKVGTDRTGTFAIPNYYGIALENGYGCVIGGTTPALRNIISGNICCGIAFTGAAANNSTVKGNYIGTDTSGTLAIPNDFGIVLGGAPSNIIGGSTANDRNIISGNLSAGVLLNGSGTDHNVIKGNYIGLDLSGSIELHNHVGVLIKSNAKNNIIGGYAAYERNVISGNDEIGVYIEACDSNYVGYNYIGPDASGLNPIIDVDSMFQGNGIELNTMARHNTVENNVISGNRVYGFVFYGQTSYNDLIGNYIGTDASGNVAMKNATGICVDASSNHNNIINNVLSGNISYGIFIVTTGSDYNVMYGNLVGTNAAGTDTIPNDVGLALGGGAKHNIIGGFQNVQKNVFSGNRFDGIEIADDLTDYNTIVGNYIGTDISGTYAIPNVNGIGVTTFPAQNTIASNIISGNEQMGIILYENADSNLVFKNKIGTDITGASALPNGLSGVLIMEGASHNVIGGDTCGNIIEYNGNGGVVILDSNSRFNTISGNAMRENKLLSGIDLYPYGCNANDAGDGDIGPNDLINYPLIQVLALDTLSGETAIWGTVDIPNADSAIVEVFVADPDSLGCGEGSVYLGQCMVNGSGVWVLLTNQVAISDLITATTTDKAGNTSEFSPLAFVTYSDGIAEESETEAGLEVQPNPFTESVTVLFRRDTPLSIDVLDLTGRTLLSYPDPNAQWLVIDDMARFEAGIYFVRATYASGNTACVRIIKH